MFPNNSFPTTHHYVSMTDIRHAVPSPRPSAQPYRPRISHHNSLEHEEYGAPSMLSRDPRLVGSIPRLPTEFRFETVEPNDSHYHTLGPHAGSLFQAQANADMLSGSLPGNQQRWQEREMTHPMIDPNCQPAQPKIQRFYERQQQRRQEQMRLNPAQSFVGQQSIKDSSRVQATPYIGQSYIRDTSSSVKFSENAGAIGFSGSLPIHSVVDYGASKNVQRAASSAIASLAQGTFQINTGTSFSSGPPALGGNYFSGFCSFMDSDKRFPYDASVPVIPLIGRLPLPSFSQTVHSDNSSVAVNKPTQRESFRKVDSLRIPVPVEGPVLSQIHSTTKTHVQPNFDDKQINFPYARNASVLRAVEKFRRQSTMIASHGLSMAQRCLPDIPNVINTANVFPNAGAILGGDKGAHCMEDLSISSGTKVPMLTERTVYHNNTGPSADTLVWSSSSPIKLSPPVTFKENRPPMCNPLQSAREQMLESTNSYLRELISTKFYESKLAMMEQSGAYLQRVSRPRFSYQMNLNDQDFSTLQNQQAFTQEGLNHYEVPSAMDSRKSSYSRSPPKSPLIKSVETSPQKLSSSVSSSRKSSDAADAALPVAFSQAVGSLERKHTNRSDASQQNRTRRGSNKPPMPRRMSSPLNDIELPESPKLSTPPFRSKRLNTASNSNSLPRQRSGSRATLQVRSPRRRDHDSSSCDRTGDSSSEQEAGPPVIIGTRSSPLQDVCLPPMIETRSSSLRRRRKAGLNDKSVLEDGSYNLSRRRQSDHIILRKVNTDMDPNMNNQLDGESGQQEGKSILKRRHTIGHKSSLNRSASSVSHKKKTRIVESEYGESNIDHRSSDRSRPTSEHTTSNSDNRSRHNSEHQRTNRDNRNRPTPDFRENNSDNRNRPTPDFRENNSDNRNRRTADHKAYDDDNRNRRTLDYKINDDDDNRNRRSSDYKINDDDDDDDARSKLSRRRTERSRARHNVRKPESVSRHLSFGMKEADCKISFENESGHRFEDEDDLKISFDNENRQRNYAEYDQARTSQNCGEPDCRTLRRKVSQNDTCQSRDAQDRGFQNKENESRQRTSTEYNENVSRRTSRDGDEHSSRTLRKVSTQSDTSQPRDSQTIRRTSRDSDEYNGRTQRKVSTQSDTSQPKDPQTVSFQNNLPESQSGQRRRAASGDFQRRNSIITNDNLENENNENRDGSEPKRVTLRSLVEELAARKELSFSGSRDRQHSIRRRRQSMKGNRPSTKGNNQLNRANTTLIRKPSTRNKESNQNEMNNLKRDNSARKRDVSRSPGRDQDANGRHVRRAVTEPEKNREDGAINDTNQSNQNDFTRIHSLYVPQSRYSPQQSIVDEAVPRFPDTALKRENSARFCSIPCPYGSPGGAVPGAPEIRVVRGRPEGTAGDSDRMSESLEGVIRVDDLERYTDDDEESDSSRGAVEKVTSFVRNWYESFKSRREYEALRRLGTILEDNRLSRTRAGSQANNKNDEISAQQTRSDRCRLLRKILNIVFIGIGISLLIAVVIVVFYTSMDFPKRWLSTQPGSKSGATRISETSATDHEPSVMDAVRYHSALMSALERRDVINESAVRIHERCVKIPVVKDTQQSGIKIGRMCFKVKIPL